MAVPTIYDTNNLLNQYKIRLNKSIKNLINTKFIALRSLRNAFVLKNPISLYEIKEQKLDKLIEDLNKNMNIYLDNKKYNLDIINNKLKLITPLNIINKEESKLKEVITKLNNILDKYLNNTKYHLDTLINTLKLVNPLNILSNGYSLVKKNDQVIKSCHDVKVKDIINIKLHEGELVSIVKEIHK